MRASRALVAAGLVLGGLGVTFAPSSAAGDARRFSTPVHVDTLDPTAEPSIAVAPDGTEYIVAPDGPGVRAPAALDGTGVGGSLIWRSTDQGRSWQLLGSYDVPTGGGDTDIAVTPDGTVWTSGLSYVACSTLARSTDRGESWFAMPLAGCGQMPVSNDRQWTATYGNHVVYTAIGDTVNAQIDLVRTPTSSRLLLPATTLRLSTKPDYQWPGNVSVDQRNGRVYTVWNTQGAPNNCDGADGSDPCAPTAASTQQRDRILVSVLPDGADTAPAPSVVASRRFDTFDSFVSGAVDRSGAIYVVWSERHPRAHATWTMLATSRDGGATWSAPVKVDRAPSTTVFPWVTAGDRGRVAVSYYGTAATGNSPQTVDAHAEWSVFSSYSTDGGRSFREYRTTGVMHRGAICTSGVACPDGTRDLLDFFETAIDRSGCLVTAYADTTVPSAGGAVVSYVRQTSGPGLRAGRACAVRG